MGWETGSPANPVLSRFAGWGWERRGNLPDSRCPCRPGFGGRGHQGLTHDIPPHPATSRLRAIFFYFFSPVTVSSAAKQAAGKSRFCRADKTANDSGLLSLLRWHLCGRGRPHDCRRGRPRYARKTIGRRVLMIPPTSSASGRVCPRADMRCLTLPPVSICKSPTAQSGFR
jgi:hypothetical protein